MPPFNGFFGEWLLYLGAYRAGILMPPGLAVFGWLAIGWLIGYLNRRSLYVFAAYCAVAGAACLIAS